MIISIHAAEITDILLIAGSGMLLLGERDSERRVRERILATREVKAATSNSVRHVFVEPPTKTPIFFRVLGSLGYRSDLPKPYNISLKITGAMAGAAGFAVLRLFDAVLPSLLSIPVAVMAAVFTAYLLFRRKRKAYYAVLFKQIPDAMSLMLRAVRAGLPVAEAIRNIGRESMSPTRGEFNRVAGEAALGMPIELTLHRLYLRTQIQEYAFFSVVIGLHAQTGGNLAETLENLADMVRRRVAMAGKARALSAEGRLSALVVAALPFAVGAFMSILNPGYMDEFVTNVNGPMLIASFAVLLFLGLISSHVLIQRSTQD